MNMVLVIDSVQESNGWRRRVIRVMTVVSDDDSSQLSYLNNDL